MSYVPFLEGETVDLCVPTKEAIRDGWADWFNDARTTTYLCQGVFPNTVEAQERFYEGLQNGSRLALLVCGKGGEDLWGTISLSTIDWVARSAQIALVLSTAKRPQLAALEAMALMTRHGFETLGLERIWAGQAYPNLAKWGRRLEVLGYRAEGFIRRGFAKGRRVHDTVMISVLYEDYAQICGKRDYWPGAEEIRKLLSLWPSGLSERIAEAVKREQAAYEREIP